MREPEEFLGEAIVRARGHSRPQQRRQFSAVRATRLRAVSSLRKVAEVAAGRQGQVRQSERHLHHLLGLTFAPAIAPTLRDPCNSEEEEVRVRVLSLPGSMDRGRLRDLQWAKRADIAVAAAHIGNLLLEHRPQVRSLPP